MVVKASFTTALWGYSSCEAARGLRLAAES